MASIRRKKRKKQKIKIGYGFIIFSLIFVYMVIRIFISMNDHDMGVFQVEESTYDTNFTETGLAIRQETINYNSKSGYVCYYIRDGEKVSKGANVYSIDETGSMYDALYDVQNGGKDLLSDEDYQNISNQISIFKAGFSPSDFSDVYEFQYSLDNKVMELYEELALEQLTSNTSFDSTFSASKSTTSGIVTYYQDGFEGFDITNIDADCFNKSDYKKETLKTGDVIEAGKPVYKIIDNEEWTIAVKVTSDEYKRIKEYSEDTVRFKIKDANKKISAPYEVVEKGEDIFILIHMTRYMAEYVSDRYLDISFVFSETKGLKIPNSAIITKDVYMIPVKYLVGGKGDTEKNNFNQIVLDDKGEKTAKQIEPTIYFSDEHFCYVDPSQIDADAVLMANDTGDTFSIKTAGIYKLEGVYCVTQGTALFKQISIIVHGDDYSIIDPNTKLGISAYDRIVLDGTSVKENQVIY